MTSRVWLADGTTRHIPMMNFHPEGIGLEEIRQALRAICGSQRGAILNSGRYQHYYGDFCSTRTAGQWMASSRAVHPGKSQVCRPPAAPRLLDPAIDRDETYKPMIPESSRSWVSLH